MMLGSWGMKSLNWYIENSYIINSMVFIYGVFLVLAHVNYKKIVDSLITEIESKKCKCGKQKTTCLIDCEEAIYNNSKFPFVAGKNSLSLRRVSTENINKYLRKDKNWLKVTDGIKVVEVKK